MAKAQRNQMFARSIVIDNEVAHVRQIQSEILAAAQAYSPRESDLFAIRLALEEALVNAIKHGNGSDPSRKVRIEYHVNPREVRIRIEDEGAGFDASEVPDPTLPENLERCTGRGILLMRHYMSQVEFQGRGNVVQMVKHMTGSQNGDSRPKKARRRS